MVSSTPKEILPKVFRFSKEKNFLSMSIGTSLSLAADLLRQDELVAIPTETVYGLAGNALSPDALVKIFEVKNRPTFDPLIVHCKDRKDLEKYVLEIPAWASALMDQYCPGPLTFLLDRQKNIPDLVTSGLPRVAIRIPAHPLVQQLLQRLPFPLAAPSANPFGYISPTEALHVHAQLGGKIPYILDGGPCGIGLESTIIGEEEGRLVIYRAGGLAIEELERLCGPLERRLGSSAPHAPGMLQSHYAPKKKLLLGNLEKLCMEYPEASVLSFQISLPDRKNLVLSPQGDMKEAARNLFAYLRQLDISPEPLIISELVPEYGLGPAINDRLLRASTPSL